MICKRQRHRLSALAAILLSLTAVCLPALAADKAAPKKNILFIAVDDLRAQLGCYGDDEILSPNIDRLAARGVRFDRAYCNVPRCGASRASVIAGVRSPADIWNCYEIPLSYVTLPAWMSKHGYRSISNGKVLHYIKDRRHDWDELWRSAEVYYGKEDWGKYNTYGIWQNHDSAAHVNPASFRGPYCESADVPDEAYQDGKVAAKTIDDLRRLKGTGEPFFLACGFWRPHLPFNAPKKYWDLYDRGKIKLADNYYPPHGNPAQNVSAKEFARYGRTAGDVKATKEFQAEARHAYYACVSYIDAQIGKVIDALDELGLADDTIIILWSDHGFLLGEHSFWGKQNTLHKSLRVPLIVAGPGLPKGATTKALVELVDLYPTLCDLTGLPRPEHLHGTSIAPILKNPKSASRPAAFSRFSGCEAVKTDRYLYTEWTDDEGRITPMLFDHLKDPDENENIANRPESAPIVERHSRMIKQELLRTRQIDVRKF